MEPEMYGVFVASVFELVFALLLLLGIRGIVMFALPMINHLAGDRVFSVARTYEVALSANGHIYGHRT